jgi:hypothetical protein
VMRRDCCNATDAAVEEAGIVVMRAGQLVKVLVRLWSADRSGQASRVLKQGR